MDLDRYQLLVQLGAGRDGVAYRGTDTVDGSTVEIRDLSGARADPTRWPLLVKRLRLATQLEHPAAIGVRELGLEHAPPYVALEWVGEVNLGAALHDAVPLPVPEALALAHILAVLLAAAHRLGLAHGRLDPGHLHGPGVRDPKIDFTGLDVHPVLERESFRKIDASCRAPEAGDDGAPDGAADVYSLGALLSWLLTGYPARVTPDLHASDLDVTAPLARLVRDMLATDPVERPSAPEVADRFAALLSPPETAQSQIDPNTLTAAAPPAPAELPPSSRCPRLGRFRLLEELGQGGQGVVYRAEDTADGSVVAIKVLRTGWERQPEALRRFRKEARLLAEVNNPFVVNLLEYNEDEGVPYLVLEFVAGRSLSRLLTDRARLNEPTALAIMVDVARALTEAHARGIVHRDIKPANILLLESSPSTTIAGMVGDGSIISTGESSTTNRWNPSPDHPRVKVSDFGLARHAIDPRSLAMTEPGTILGTPQYMAPEQCTARPVDSRTDIYAMGATLFHMLAGRPPFVAPTREEIYAMHCHDPPPRLERFNPAVSDGVCRVVEKALAKAPEARHAHAEALLRDLESLLRGEPTSVAIHPTLPACDPRNVLRFDFEWELEASPRQLWPHVSNTDRLDRALGFAPVRYTTRSDPGRGVRRFAEGRKAGMTEVGEEYPYEWIEPRRMGVLREYSQGPFRWLVSAVELTPRAGGGTILTHRLRLEPRGWKMRLGSPVGVGVFFRRDLERVYRRIDAALTGKLGHPAAVDPFEALAALPGARRRRLDHRLDVLGERGIDPAVVERLGGFLAEAPAPEVARIRPLALARRWGLDPDAVVAACLHGAREGLLVLLWDLLCPVCRLSSEVKDTLRAIREHGYCEACHLDFELDFANSVELIFRAHPEIREADPNTYCIGGPAHSPHVFAQVRIAAGERIELDLALPEGAYRLRGPQLSWSVDFRVRSSAPARRWDLCLSQGPPPELPRALRAGGQVLALTNNHGRELLVRVERTAPRDDILTAARASVLALFRDLFPGEVLTPGQLVSLATVTLLVTELDPDQADALYEGRGDVRAFGVIYEHFRLLEDAIRHGGGALVKSTGEGVLAAFSEPEDAVRVGLGLQDLLARGAATRDLRLRAGIHRGPALAVTLNDHLDYFGTTARQAMRLLPLARGGELVLTRTVATDPKVAALLQARGLEGEVLPTDLPDHPHLLRLAIP